MPQNTSFLDHIYDVNSQSVDPQQKPSSSCPPEITTSKHHGGRQRQDNPPPFLSGEEIRDWMKDRQKKDNHNISM